MTSKIWIVRYFNYSKEDHLLTIRGFNTFVYLFYLANYIDVAVFEFYSVILFDSHLYFSKRSLNLKGKLNKGSIKHSTKDISSNFLSFKVNLNPLIYGIRKTRITGIAIINVIFQ